MPKKLRPVALLFFVGNVLLANAEEATRTFILDPVKLGIPKDASVEPQSAVRNFLTAAGVNFEAAPSPKFFYNTRTGILNITASDHDLDSLEHTLKKPSQPQVLLKVVLAEFPESRKDEIQKLIGTSLSGPFALPDALADLRTSHRQDLFSRILTESDANKIIQSLQTHEGTAILSPPPQTAVTGRPVQIQFEQSRSFTVEPFNTPVKIAQPDTASIN